jgi:hypothetical protein
MTKLIDSFIDFGSLFELPVLVFASVYLVLTVILKILPKEPRNSECGDVLDKAGLSHLSRPGRL